MLIFKMAFRNIFRQKRRTIFTGLSVVGGYALAVIFIGWSDGSYNNIIDQFTRSLFGHIQIHEKTYLDRPSIQKTIADPAKVERVLDATRGVELWAPRVYSPGLAALGEKSAGVEIIGVDPARESVAFHFEKKVFQGRSFSGEAAGEVIIGRGLAEVLQAKIGDQIIVLTQAADGSIASALLPLAGIAQSGDQTSDRIALYMPLRRAQDFLALGERIHEIAVVVDRLGRVLPISRTLTGAIDDPRLSVDPWQVFAKSFYHAMQTDQAGTWVMLVVIVLIVAVGVLNTILMSVLERRREYGLMKAIGTKPGQIVRLVQIEAVVLSAMAMVIGAGLGLGANLILARHGIKFGEGLTYGGMVFDTMKAEVNIRSFTIPAVTVLISSLLVSFFPALKAARTEPAKTMRMQ